MNWEQLQAIADQEVSGVIAALPRALRTRAQALPVTFQLHPDPQWVEEGTGSDSLGLFVGPAYAEEATTSSPLPAQIILFLENLWDYAGEQEPVFREEVRRTYMHELGHYLGLAEDDLWERGLD